MWTGRALKLVLSPAAREVSYPQSMATTSDRPRLLGVRGLPRNPKAPNP